MENNVCSSSRNELLRLIGLTEDKRSTNLKLNHLTYIKINVGFLTLHTPGLNTKKTRFSLGSSLTFPWRSKSFYTRIGALECKVSLDVAFVALVWIGRHVYCVLVLKSDGDFRAPILCRLSSSPKLIICWHEL
jgi:hypothetical protein